MTKVQVLDAGYGFARIEPVVLREGKTTRLVFRAQIVENRNDHWQPVRGELRWQRRANVEAEWADEPTLKLTKMTAGSGVHLELSTSELKELTQAVRGLYGYFWKHGMPKPSTEIELPKYAKDAKELSTTAGLIEPISQQHGSDVLASILEWVGETENTADVVQHLRGLGVTNLAQISSVAGVIAIKKVLEIWYGNQDNPDEEFWQSTLQQFSFVLSQAFSSPVVILKGKAYVGGKSVDNTGGNVTDFLLQNVVSRHAVIVEIKTPQTQLLIDAPYRKPNVYAVTREISGGVVQTATAKDGFLKEFSSLTSDCDLSAADPSCLLIAGHLGQLDTQDKKTSFELFRQSQRVVEILTFDELFRKIEVLLSLLEGESQTE